MKIVAFGHPARIGTLSSDGRVIDLNLAYAALVMAQRQETRPHALADAVLPSSLVDFLLAGRPAIDAAVAAFEFAQRHAEELADSAEDRIIIDQADLRIGAPLPSLASRIFCGGGNYVRHLSGVRKLWKSQDLSNEDWERFIREKPFWGFYKLPQTVVGPDAPVRIPAWVQAFDYEIELAAFIGRVGKNLSIAEARQTIVGYSILNDWCIRDSHLIVGAQDFDEGVLSFAWQKNASGASLGPALAIDEITDPYDLKMETKVNGAVRQSGNTGEMVIRLDEIVAYISKYVTLYPGDIITPGTCVGTAFDSSQLLPEADWVSGKLKVNDALFLKPGDRVDGSIAGLGVLSNEIVAE